MPLSSARRVILLSYNATTRTIDFRHYLIHVRPVGVSRSVRKIIDGTTGGIRKRVLREGSTYSAAPSDMSSQASFAALRAKGMPDLRSAKDISDYILNRGELGFLSSASEAESDASVGEDEGIDSRQVELSAPYVGRGNKRLSSIADETGASGSVEKRAVRLTELGPRLELGLVKIEDGIGDGKGEVLFHEFIQKTPKEAADIARRAKEKEKLAQSRRENQEKNVKRKLEEKEAKKKEREAKKTKGERMDVEEEEHESDSESEAEEFEYEDMFSEERQAKTNGADDQVAGGDSEEIFEEDDDSDLDPIAINEGSSGDDENAERPTQGPQKKMRIISSPQRSSLKPGREAVGRSAGRGRSGKGGRVEFNMRAPQIKQR